MSFEDKYKEWHQKISYVKSGVRIASCMGAVLLLSMDTYYFSILFLAIGLMIAEVLGIVEEWI